MKRMRAVWSAAGAILGAGLLVGATTSSATAETDSAKVEWSATHGTATASGLRWTEPRSDIGNRLVVEGDLKNTGSGCYSVWVRWIHDLAPGPERLQTTVCGSGSVPVDVVLDMYWPTTGGYLRVCKGKTNTDCGEQISLTTWPIERASR